MYVGRSGRIPLSRVFVKSVLAGGGLDTGKAQILAVSSVSLMSIDFVLAESILRVVSILSTLLAAVQGELSILTEPGVLEQHNCHRY